MFSLKIHLITYPGWKQTIGSNRPDKAAGQRKLAFSMKINSLKDTCQCLWQVLQNMRDDAATQFIFRAIMWPFIKLPSSRKKNHCLYFPKRKRISPSVSSLVPSHWLTSCLRSTMSFPLLVLCLNILVMSHVGEIQPLQLQMPAK